jgi:hypothetical protein
VAEGVALEMLCTPWVPRVRIPPSPPVSVSSNARNEDCRDEADAEG